MATTPKLSSATANFASAYKYKVAGKTDLLFSTIGQLFSDNNVKFNMFKNSRLNEVKTQAAIANNADLTTEEKKVASAEASVQFLSTATRTLKQNIDSETSPRKIAASINYIVKELQASVNNYISGRGGTTTAVANGEDGGVNVDISSDAAAASGGYSAAADQKFLNDVQYMVNSLKSLLLKQKGPLRMMGKYFDTNYYQADRRLGEIAASIAAFTTPAATGETGEGTETGGETGTGTGTETGGTGDTGSTGGTGSTGETGGTGSTGETGGGSSSGGDSGSGTGSGSGSGSGGGTGVPVIDILV